jgi:subtilisin family serine protease
MNLRPALSAPSRLNAVFRFALPAFLLGVSTPSLAARIYQIPSGTVRTFSAQDDVVDSIPQLGVIVTREPLADAQGLRDLGDVSLVHLIEPRDGHVELNAAAADSGDKIPSGLWGLKAIHLAEAWKISKGGGVVVAVSDTGVDSAHKELKGQMWRNPGETGADSNGRDKSSNGIDDDGNGYVDDVYGWDFVKKKPGGRDHHYHGTHVAGTIAAVSGKSMTGVAPEAKIMDVSFLDSNGSGDDVDGAKTIVYAVDHGAKLVNCSWGSTDKPNAVLAKAIQYAQDHGVLVIAAAGNDGSNNDKHTFTPSGLANENIVSVGATSSASGAKASFSNYGSTTVDLAAPGENIYSLSPGGGHRNLSGTSMATPHVSGVAALVWSAHPTYSAAQVKTALMSVQPAKAWKTKSVSGGILEADLALTH